MSQLTIVYEDALHEAILRKILGTYTDVHWVNAHGKTKIMSRLESYIEAAYHQKVVVVRDLDNDASCAPEFLRRHIPESLPQDFVFRLSVREAEVWLMADKLGFCNYFRIGYQQLSRRRLESQAYPKELLLRLVHGGRLAQFRKASIVLKRKNQYHRMYGYNPEIVKFVNTTWNIDAAAQNSDSLQRTINAINELIETGND